MSTSVSKLRYYRKRMKTDPEFAKRRKEEYQQRVSKNKDKATI